MEGTQSNDFQTRVRKYIEERFLGEVVQFEKTNATKYYIKFKTRQDVWFQTFRDKIEIDSVDFEKRTLSGFIYASGEFNID